MSDSRAVPVLVLTQYSLPDHKRNMNAYQRLYYGSEHAAITLLMRRNERASAELGRRVRVRHAPVQSRWAFFLYALAYAAGARWRGCRVIITDPSGFAGVGLLARALLGCFWVLDLWDRPRWRPGQHQPGHRPPLADRLLFRAMRRADLFLLSVLPQAVRDIDPPAERCVQFPNAIDPSLVARAPPVRPVDDDTLHLAVGKSMFDDTVGLDLLVDAARRLAAQACPFHIHVIGGVPPAAFARVQASPVAQHFTLHGVTEAPRAEVFGQAHVGLVPYLPYEDLSYIFPIKVLEHLSQGNPVVASNLPGLAATIRDGYNGLLVEPGDPRALAEAVLRLQRDRALWERLAHNALESVRLYDARDKNRRIFAEVLSRSGALTAGIARP
jgi:glycosyltransferase involved in cell wall biosynthesis